MRKKMGEVEGWAEKTMRGWGSRDNRRLNGMEE